MRSKEDKVAFIANLKAGVKALEDSNTPIPNSLLESFSPKNCLAILYQRPSATNCAGFHNWKEAGRSVIKGAKGIAILIPLGVDEEDNLRFSWRYVFDIADTQEITSESPKLARELSLA
jgi:hypothetical protein